MRKRFAVSVVLSVCLALVAQGSASAKWPDNSGNLPGMDQNVALKAGLIGAGGAALIGVLLYHRHHQRQKAELSPLAIPSVLAFDRADKERELSIINNTQSPLNVAEVVVDHGFSIAGSFSFPKLIHAGEQLDVPISRAAPFSAKRGRISVTMIDSNGKTVTRLVALRAASFRPAQ